MKAIVICFKENKVICINENFKEVKQYDALTVKESEITIEKQGIQEDIHLWMRNRENEE